MSQIVTCIEQKAKLLTTVIAQLLNISLVYHSREPTKGSCFKKQNLIWICLLLRSD